MISLVAQSWSLIPYQFRLDSRAPLGVALPTPNVPPVITGAPSSVTRPDGSTYDFSLLCSDANDDVLSYTMIAGATNGFSINSSSGVITWGSVTQDLTIEVSDGEFTAEATFNAVVDASVTDHPIATQTTTLTFDGTTEGVQPGDTITLANGTHGPLVLRNLIGTALNPIVVRNTSGGQAIIRKNASTPSTTEVCIFRGCRYVTVDGGNGHSLGTYGIKVTSTSVGGNDSATTFLKVDDSSAISSFIEFDQVEVDGGWTSGTRTAANIGVQVNDHGSLRADNPGVFRESITFKNGKVHQCWGEGLYIGPNYTSHDIPLKDIVISGNTIQNNGREGLQGKEWWEASNLVHHNIVTGNGLRGGASQNTNISLLSTTADIYNNWIEDADDKGIMCWTTDGPSATTPTSDELSYNGGDPYSNFLVRVYNNVVVGNGAQGIRCGGGTGLVPVLAQVFNNTVHQNGNIGIDLGSDASASSWIRNNVVTDSTGGTDIDDGPGTSAYNTTGSGASVYTDAVGPTYDFSLLTAIAATGTPGTDIATTDYEDTARPQGATSDRGAYEHA